MPRRPSPIARFTLGMLSEGAAGPGRPRSVATGRTWRPRPTRPPASFWGLVARFRGTGPACVGGQASVDVQLLVFRWYAPLRTCLIDAILPGLFRLRRTIERRARAASALAWGGRPRCTASNAVVWAPLGFLPRPGRPVVWGTAIWRSARLAAASRFRGAVSATAWGAMGWLKRGITATVGTAGLVVAPALVTLLRWLDRPASRTLR